MRRVRAFLKAVGAVQSRIIMTLFYVLILPPFALVARLKARTRPETKGSYWRARERRSDEIRDARMQW